MSPLIVKIIYLLTGSCLLLIVLNYKKVKDHKFLIPLVLCSMSFCFAAWGITILFQAQDGYPSQFMFYITSLPPFISTAITVLKIKK